MLLSKDRQLSHLPGIEKGLRILVAIRVYKERFALTDPLDFRNASTDEAGTVKYQMQILDLVPKVSIKH